MVNHRSSTPPKKPVTPYRVLLSTPPTRWSKRLKSGTSRKYYKAFYYGKPKWTRSYPRKKAWYGPHTIYHWDSTKGGTNSLTGVELKQDEPTIVCNTGYHCSDSIEGALIFYNSREHARSTSLYDSELESVRVYEVTPIGPLEAQDEMTPYNKFTKYATSQMTIGSEVLGYELQAAQLPVVQIERLPNGSTKIIYYEYGQFHRDETEGPAVIIRDSNGDLEEVQYYYHGCRQRTNGPCQITTRQLHFGGSGCWMILWEKISSFPREATMEALMAPDHTWEEKTCGEGQCWQWTHNPQRYGLEHTQPPKEMFIRRLQDEYKWYWAPEMKWQIRHKKSNIYKCDDFKSLSPKELASILQTYFEPL